MIVSASMPFSLASASIVCINGFCIVVTSTGQKPDSAYGFLELHFEASPCDQSQRQPVSPSIWRFEQHLVLIDAVQAAFKRFLVVHRLAHHDLRQPSGESPVVIHVPQRT